MHLIVVFGLLLAQLCEQYKFRFYNDTEHLREHYYVYSPSGFKANNKLTEHINFEIILPRTVRILLNTGS